MNIFVVFETAAVVSDTTGVAADVAGAADVATVIFPNAFLAVRIASVIAKTS